MNAPLRYPGWLLIAERLLCLLVLVFVILIWKDVKKPELPCPDPGTLMCECPQLPDPGGPGGTPIDPEPDTVAIRGRVKKNSNYVNGVTVKLEEDTGSYTLRRTGVSHYSQYGGTSYGEPGWYSFVISVPNTVMREFQVCDLSGTICEEVTVEAAGAAVNPVPLIVPDIVIP